jgi:hypothetical protein
MMTLSPAADHVLVVGATYHWYRNYMGKWFGPDTTVNKDRGMPAGEHANWRRDFDTLLKHYRKDLDIAVLRISLLGNAWNYGTGADDTFESLNPDSTDAQKRAFASANLNAYYSHYTEILTACKANKMFVIPSLIGFDAFRVAKEIPGGGRAKLINSKEERRRFLKYMLEPLLVLSKPFKDYIYCWELISEPIWVVKDLPIHKATDAYNALRKRYEEWYQKWGKNIPLPMPQGPSAGDLPPNPLPFPQTQTNLPSTLPKLPDYWPVQTLTVDLQAMKDFIREGLDMIEGTKFDSLDKPAKTKKEKDEAKDKDRKFLSTLGNVFVEKIGLPPILIPPVSGLPPWIPATYQITALEADDDTFEVTSNKRGDDYKNYQRQFHWYPEGLFRRTLPPWGDRRATPLLEKGTMAMVGEISGKRGLGGRSASKDVMDWSWPDVDQNKQNNAADATWYRLARLERRGYRLGMLWPDGEHGRPTKEYPSNRETSAYSEAVETGIKRFNKNPNPIPRTK